MAAVFAMLVVPVTVLIVFAPFLLRVWLGADISAVAATPTRILGIGVMFNALAFVPANFLSASGRPDLNAKFHMIELVVQIPLAWWLVTTFGIPGAAMAWSARVAFDAVLLFWACGRMLDNHQDSQLSPSPDDPLPARMAG